MQKLAEVCLHRPVFASMLILSMVVVGVVGYFHLGVDRFPSVDLPAVNVRTSLPGLRIRRFELFSKGNRSLVEENSNCPYQKSHRLGYPHSGECLTLLSVQL